MTDTAATPVDNEAFYPGPGATTAPPFAGTLRIAQAAMRTEPELTCPVLQGRDARVFPAVQIEFFTLGDILVPVRRGDMIRESHAGDSPSYWCVIPQCGRVWREPAQQGAWSHAAFALMLVGDTENHAHQGLATFLYEEGAVRELRFQFVQQTAPYLLKQHFVAWGTAPVEYVGDGPADVDACRAAVSAEFAQRLPSRPWNELVAQLPPGTLDGFGGPLHPKWWVQVALFRDGILYCQDVPTPCGRYPYPQEMRFGVRSIMKSVAAPLSLLRLAQVYGPYVLTLKIGDYVDGLDPKYRRVRFLDAANMATGFGGTGTWQTHPNDTEDGYLDGDYDAWYTARSHDEKIAQIAANLGPYPWEPGTVMRYRDQDFYLLGVAIDRFLKSRRGEQADAWQMLKAEVFAPIGIAQAPAVSTIESANKAGFVWFNAGYYPTLDELAKIAVLYQNLGAWNGRQILHRQLTQDLLAAKDAIVKHGDASIDAPSRDEAGAPRYKMGFHFTPHRSDVSQQWQQLPTMSGSGENEIVLYPNRLISIRLAKAAQLQGEQANGTAGGTTILAVARLAPF